MVDIVSGLVKEAQERDEDYTAKGIGCAIGHDTGEHQVIILRSKETDEYGRFRTIKPGDRWKIKLCLFCSFTGTEHCPSNNGGTCIQVSSGNKDYFEFDLRRTDRFVTEMIKTPHRIKEYAEKYRDFVRIKYLEDKLNIEPEPPKEKFVFKFSKKATAGVTL